MNKHNVALKDCIADGNQVCVAVYIVPFFCNMFALRENTVENNTQIVASEIYSKLFFALGRNYNRIKKLTGKIYYIWFK